jgi:1-acyl-sn-glycerol-3-phosphate acyltransferase
MSPCDFAHSAAYASAKVFFGALLKPYFRVRVIGAENLPREGGLLVAANHASYADPLVLGAFLRRRLWFIMAEEQFRKPVVHLFSRLMDVIPVKAGAAFQLGPIRRALGLLKAGKVVAIFPEGRRSASGKLLPGQPGLGLLAGRAGVPILPVAITGTREAYPVGQRFPRPGKVRLYVGKPLTDLARLSPEELAERVMEAIADLLETHGHADYLDEAHAGA